MTTDKKREQIERLQGLWSDEDPGVLSYQSWTIVYRLCMFSQKNYRPNVQWVLNHLYVPMVKVDEIDQEERHIIEYGIDRWEKMDCPRVDDEQLIEEPQKTAAQTWWGGAV